MPDSPSRTPQPALVRLHFGCPPGTAPRLVLSRRGHIDILDSPNRRRVFELVQADPGIGLREVIDATGLAFGTVRHHLTVLVRHGFLVERMHGKRFAFFDASNCREWRHLATLRDPDLRLLHAVVLEKPGCEQKTIVDAMGLSGWKRNTTVHRLRSLERAGLLTAIWQGRSKRHWALRPETSFGLPMPIQAVSQQGQRAPMRLPSTQ